MIKRIYIGIATIFMSITLNAQENIELISEGKMNNKAWELGVGGSLINFNRISLTGFESTPENYLYNLKANHLMGGANLYLARELNKWFYVDLQGTLGISKNEIEQDKKHNLLYTAGLGLQWRLSPLFKSQYVEPYLRVGVNYFHKDFKQVYSGNFKDDVTGQAHWESSDVWNPNGRENDKDTYFPLSFGVGVNAWLSNSIGLGVQGDYFMPTDKNLPRFAQVSGRVLFRFGGVPKTHKVIEKDTITMVKEVPVEKIIEKKVYVQSEGSSDSDSTKKICDLFNNVNFKFDRADLTPESERILDNVAEILKQYEGEKFLITGFTDARGSFAYNLRLSQDRARSVVDALKARGVSSDMLKSRGVGKKATSVGAHEANDVRLGDRKVTIEHITNMSYWNALK